MIDMDVAGFVELEQLIEQVGKVPQKVATKAANQGAKVVLQEAKQRAPHYTGLLEDALIIKGEKAKSTGKKVYQITFDRQLSGDGKNGLVKISDITGKRAYYPNSQEFGWTIQGHKHLYALHYMKNSALSVGGMSEAKMVEVAKRELDKAIAQYSRDMERSNNRPRGTYSRASTGYLNLRTGR